MTQSAENDLSDEEVWRMWDEGEPVEIAPPQDFMCACGTDLLRANRDNESGEIDVCFWKYTSWPVPWHQRLRGLWRFLKKGDGFADMVVLDRKEAVRFGLWLLGAGWFKQQDNSAVGATSVITSNSSTNWPPPAQSGLQDGSAPK